ncbi:hypothetical protein [Modicisalibacter tunisiensis]|uniref:SWIM-type domain-containing protein n=1 Tax=Modicisalibacter tunisiensis TaxID=390637 RepID=A0ABS7X3E1_9GAMM|nr:hypothetical protein [Modicisalibacter tunisiensis]MBZ9568507.1 hypothetical protein [Modicisalibacter tunisiensis]
MTGIGSIKGSAQELRERQSADARQREGAKWILNPNEISGDYDASRMLETTLGGVRRKITNDDLAAFRHNARVAGQRFKGGINVRGVVDLSTNEDRKRARTQIRMAVAAASRPVSTGALEVRFITNASGLTKGAPNRYQPVVEFLDFSSVVADGSLTPQKAAVRLRQGGIRFNCDCDHHRYRLRYIATIGGYNAGRDEAGFPKITNPGLSGVACKHVLRVMAEIEGGSAVQMFLAKAVEKVRAGMTGRQYTSEKEAERQARKQDSRPMAANAQDTGDRDFDRARRALRRQSRATTTKPKRTANGSKRMQALGASPAARDKLMATTRDLGLTPEEAVAILQAAAKGKS